MDRRFDFEAFSVMIIIIIVLLLFFLVPINIGIYMGHFAPNFGMLEFLHQWLWGIIYMIVVVLALYIFFSILIGIYLLYNYIFPRVKNKEKEKVKE